MKRSLTGRNRLVAGASILTAVGAVALGATISSGAMASVPDDTTSTVSMISIDSDGNAVECTFDSDDLPFIPAPPVLEGAVEGTVDGAVASSGVVEMTEAVELTPEVMAELGIDPEDLGPVESVEPGAVPSGAPAVGELEVAGIAVAAPLDEDVVFEIGPDGDLVATEVTEGTPEQCQAMLEDAGS